MFYKQFSTITDVFNPDFVERFDYWLATLPRMDQKNITASVVAARLDSKLVLAEHILNYAEEKKILKKHYVLCCPVCEKFLGSYLKDDLVEILTEPQYCDECEEDKVITLDNIYTAYEVILDPDITEEELEKVIEQKLNQGEGTKVNFSKADSLANNPTNLYEVFYNPSESAYDKFKELRKKLDEDYGKNTTAKGSALEALALEIFNQINGVKGTNEVKTETNQFDCTCLSTFLTGTLSVFTYMAPYFIIECKNEPDKKPNNTYCNKLLSIMDTNEAQLGIVLGRKDATDTCFKISREHYLKHSGDRRQQIIITLCDKDLDLIIDQKINLLEYLMFKIFQVTANSPNSTFDMFNQRQ